jgi:hypothetical protein
MKDEGINQLYRALEIAKKDAENQAEKHRAALTGKPLYGWSSEKHITYHKDRQEKAQACAVYLLTRMLQIDPD